MRPTSRTRTTCSDAICTARRASRSNRCTFRRGLEHLGLQVLDGHRPSEADVAASDDHPQASARDGTFDGVLAVEQVARIPPRHPPTWIAQADRRAPPTRITPG